jgi:hypothetical protein
MTSIGSVNFELDGNLTYSLMLGCLKRIETGITFQTLPNKIGFTLQKREWGFKYGCEGEARISSLLDGKSNVVIKVRSSNDTIIYTLGVTLITILLLRLIW